MNEKKEIVEEQNELLPIQNVSGQKVQSSSCTQNAEILIVEDNMYMNIAIQTLVTSFVDACDSATDGEEALRLVMEK